MYNSNQEREPYQTYFLQPEGLLQQRTKKTNKDKGETKLS